MTPSRSVRLLLHGLLACAVCAACDQRPSPPAPQAAASAERKPDSKALAFAGAVGERAQLLRQDEAAREAILDTLEFLDRPLPRPVPPQPPLCRAQPPVTEEQIDVDRSLFVHDRATLDARDFSLKRTLSQLAAQAVSAGAAGTTAEAVFKELWDTQNKGPSLGLGAHCNDNEGTLNGFPSMCRAAEGQQALDDAAAGMARYLPIALVNRLDLAHQGWRNCGEHRVVYGRQLEPGQRQKSFIIFEAVLPNPFPGCQEGCRPVMAFWKSLSESTMDSPAARAAALERFYYTGIRGFRPVIHVDHYSVAGVSSSYGGSGSGQIRTNQFLEQPWMLKEFKLSIDCGARPCELDVVPVMVKVNPFGTLWDEAQGVNPAAPLHAKAQAFQGDVLGEAGALAANDLNKITYAVNPAHDAAQSDSQTGSPPDNYLPVFGPITATNPATPGLFRQLFEDQAQLKGLTSTHLVNRAMTQSCAGCHNPGAFGLTSADSLAPVATGLGGWPPSAGFVHTIETASSGIHPLSEALTKVFLPARRKFLVERLSSEACQCKRRFLPVPLDVERLRKIEDEVTRRFATRLGPLNEQLLGRPAPEAEARLRAQIAELDIQRDATVAAELRKVPLRIDPPPLELRPQVLHLDAAARAGGDRLKLQTLRREEVLSILLKEPPRRTVTGHFRVH